MGSLSLNRARFEELCIDLFKTCMPPVEQVLKDSETSKGAIDEIVLVGGSTRIPKIEVTFDIDANGILNVSAEEKGCGKVEKITITNDGGRLSKEEIDKMVADAEKFKDEDAKVREQLEKKNELENYCFQMKYQLDDANMRDKFTSDDKTTILETCATTLRWLEGKQNADADEYVEKK